MARFSLSFVHTGSSEDRGDYWAAYSHEFSIVTYGASRDQAESKLDSAIMLMLDTLMVKGRDHLVARFHRGGVRYLLTASDGEEEKPAYHRFSRDMTHEFAVS